MKIFITGLVLLVALVSSCKNLHYTNYGRPFDFLKLNNDYFIKNKTPYTDQPSLIFKNDSSSIQDYKIDVTTPVDVTIKTPSESENEFIFENKSGEFSKEKPHKIPASTTIQSDIQNNRPARPKNYISLPSILKVKSQKNVTLKKHTIIDVLILIGIFTFFTLFFMLVFKITFWLAIIIAGINLSFVLLLTFFLLLRAFTF
jgi:hypothetical protein